MKLFSCLQIIRLIMVTLFQIAWTIVIFGCKCRSTYYTGWNFTALCWGGWLPGDHSSVVRALAAHARGLGLNFSFLYLTSYHQITPFVKFAPQVECIGTYIFAVGPQPTSHPSEIILMFPTLNFVIPVIPIWWFCMICMICMVFGVCFRDGTLAHWVTHSVGASLSTPG